MMMSAVETLTKMHEFDSFEEPREQDDEPVSTELTPSQLRMKALMERHEAVLAFNAKLEAALKDGNTAVIDECIAHSQKNDYMAQHRTYMAELTKDLATHVGN